VIGARSADLSRLFGPPRLDVVEGDARKLQFVGPACVLDVYLYPQGTGAKCAPPMSMRGAAPMRAMWTGRPVWRRCAGNERFDIKRDICEQTKCAFPNNASSRLTIWFIWRQGTIRHFGQGDTDGGANRKECTKCRTRLAICPPTIRPD
jgi:hypothetical protein